MCTWSCLRSVFSEAIMQHPFTVSQGIKTPLTHKFTALIEREAEAL